MINLAAKREIRYNMYTREVEKSIQHFTIANDVYLYKCKWVYLACWDGLLHLIRELFTNFYLFTFTVTVLVWKYATINERQTTINRWWIFFSTIFVRWCDIHTQCDRICWFLLFRSVSFSFIYYYHLFSSFEERIEAVNLSFELKANDEKVTWS